MGTKSTTKIYEDGKLILALYKQYDGYTDGWGKELKDFIKSGEFVNGIPLTNKERVFNGIGCFALQLVEEFKEGAGGLYATTEDDNQEYNYILDFKHNKNNWNKLVVSIKCLEEKKYNEKIILMGD